MLTLAYYLLKVSACSGLLYSYYLLVLRNKKFHQYNRFYLLSVIALSLIIPIAKVRIWSETNEQEIIAVRLLKVVAMRDAVAEQSLRSAFGSWIINNLVLVIFCLISITFLALLTAGIIRISKLIRSNPNRSWNNVSFIFSEAKGTPFSFFKYIFWNKNIDLQTQEGKLILQHELTHVREKHSADKLFIQLALVIAWINPFFWIIRKELNMIHEFIADENAVNNGDVSAFSAMLLKTVYPQHSFTTLSNSFFHSPIKRRLIMFTTSTKPSYSYLRRLMILPLLSFLTVFFSFKIKGQSSNKSHDNSAKVFTGKVVISNKISRTDTTINIQISSAGTDKAIINELINTKNDEDTSAKSKTLVVMDEEQMSWEDYNKKAIKPEQIKEINILKGKTATDKYGEKGANGVVEITTVSKDVVIVDVNLDGTTRSKDADSTEPQFARVFTKVENPPYYAKGMAAFANYIQSNVQYPKEAIENKTEGAVSIKFIIDETGRLSHFEKLSHVGFGLEEEAIRLLRNSSDWKSGITNGHKVPVEIVQQIIFRLPRRNV